MRVKIQDITYHLPERVVTNEELAREHPGWDMEEVENRAGVVARHIAREDETALDLTVEACKKMISRNPDLPGKIDGIIFCTQSEDYVMPPNACLLHRELDLADSVLAFDFTLACSGYVYGLALAQGLIQTGAAKNILLATADTYSKYIHQQDRSARTLFGDAGAVSWIKASDSNQGVVDILCSTSGKGYDQFIIPAGGCRRPRSDKTSIPETDESGNVRTPEHIHMNGLGVLTFVNSKVPEQIRQLLERNGLTMEDMGLCVFHQASKLALDSLERLLEIPPEKNYRNLRDIGNTVSASIPIALKDALDEPGRVSREGRVLISGFGVGLSWASAIIEI
ncbi:ketoacyl-ACP synthase III [Acidobacteria bacterium AH-259-L09]|nr:ketoacyl-ACP synthase III [Acidobacteria bacterium AH-259-L09]